MEPRAAETPSGIDHLVVLVRDLDAAARAAAALGFRVTDRGVHPHFGTANHLIVLQNAYLEILTVVEPRPANALLRSRGEHSLGRFALALRTRDANFERMRLRALGVGVGSPVEFGRGVVVDGRDCEARFRVLMPGDDPDEELLFFYCEHLTPELVWRREWQQHANGALSLEALTIAAADPEAFANRYARLWDAPRPEAQSAGICVLLAKQAIHVITPDRLQLSLAPLFVPQAVPRTVVASVSVENLATTRGHLTAVAHLLVKHDRPQHLLAAHPDLPGLAIEFTREKRRHGASR